MSIINHNEIFDKNINFLLGSGASFGLLPTLSLGLLDSETEKGISLETLATRYQENEIVSALLFSWYVKEVIKPAAYFDIDDVGSETPQGLVIKNYQQFLTTLLAIIGKKSTQKKANIFTTNYDGLIAHTAEDMLLNSNVDFILNDGGSGFVKRTLFARNFDRFYRDQGVFDRHSTDVPQINLLQLHGSVYWYKHDESIEISYDKNRATSRINEVPVVEDQSFTELLFDAEKNDAQIGELDIDIVEEEILGFWEQYQKLPIVNPTKWKFYETVFEEHYYQMLRLLSYELEKPDTVFITFGFSFADEHILNLVKRSLSNPTLQMFICCFDEHEEALIRAKFNGFLNVVFIRVEGVLDFTAFNKEVFSVSSSSDGAE